MSSNPARVRVVVGLASLLAVVGQAAARDGAIEPAAPMVVARPGVLNLRTGDVTVAELPNALTARADGFAAGSRYVVQLDGPMTPARRAALGAAGVVVGQYLPTDAYLADLSRATVQGVQALGFVTWAGEFQNAWKLAPEIGTVAFTTPERQAIAARGEVAVTVYLFENEALAPALAAVRAVPGVTVQSSGASGADRTITLTAPAGSVGALAGVAGVQFVEECPELTVRNGTNRWIVQSNVLNMTPLYTNGLHGEGQIVGVVDEKVAVNHCSFQDTVNPIGPQHRKIRAYNTSQGYGFHGTHVAGTAVGDAGADNNTRGVAYLGRLVFNTIPNFAEAPFFNMLTQHYSQGATVHTNSWGNDGTVQYDGLCRAIDNFTWLNDDNLVCFAVTNGGFLKNPENAKNCFAVGATQDTPNQQNHCTGGQGPTNDGRRKPEIYAPGCNTQSSTGSSGCGTTGATGTSMASPAIAGTALLVRQYFADGYYPSGAARASDEFAPSGALVKAVMINASVDMTGVAGYPSAREGWGRVLADNGLYFPGDARRLIVQDVRNNSAGALATGGSDTFEIEVNGGGGAQGLRATLQFHDAPAALNASFAPINNLDLRVTSPSGSVYRGNVFSNGFSAIGGAPDAINNLEQVHLATPEIGIWTVEVIGTAVNVGAQGYALAITGDVAEPVACRVDFNGDGTVDVQDFLAFLGAYGDGLATADFNGDGMVTIADFLAFLGEFSTGC